MVTKEIKFIQGLTQMQAGNPSSSFFDFSGSIEDGHKKNVDNALRRHAFESQLADIAALPVSEQTAALQNFAFKENSPDQLTTRELMRLFTAFNERRAFSDMMLLVDTCRNYNFFSSPAVIESYLAACNRTGEYNKVLEVEKNSKNWKSNNALTSTVYGAFGKAWFKKHSIAKQCSASKNENIIEAYKNSFPDDPDLAQVESNAVFCLQRSKENYEKGFLMNFEYYPGINTVYTMMDLGEYAHAQNVARMVYLACLRDGGKETMDSWCAATLVEAACLMKGEVEDVLLAVDRFVQTRPESWHINAVLKNISDAKTKMPHAENYRLFDLAIHRIGQAAPDILTGNYTSPEWCQTSDPFVENSFSYRGIASNFIGANFVPGNIKFGGQLPDHCVTRTDLEQIEKLFDVPLKDLIGEQEALSYPKHLKDIPATRDFLDVCDKIIRHAFSTDECDLEDIMSDGHAVYDERVRSLLKFSGVDDCPEAHSHTNISVVLALGLGDCRHHAQVKQILFDVWQKKHMNACLKDAYDALENSDIDRFEKNISEFHYIEAIELRTMDVALMSPIKINAIYSPQQTLDGAYIAEENGKLNTVENHTLNILIQRNRNHQIRDVMLADSFYQTRHKWKHCTVRPEETLRDEDGKIMLYAGTVAAQDPVTQKQMHYPVYLKPAHYAGKRDEVLKDETGQLRLLGIPITQNFDLVESLSQPHQKKMGWVDNIRRWYISTGRTPRPSAPQNKNIP